MMTLYETLDGAALVALEDDAPARAGMRRLGRNVAVRDHGELAVQVAENRGRLKEMARRLRTAAARAEEGARPDGEYMDRAAARQAVKTILEGVNVLLDASTREEA